MLYLQLVHYFQEPKHSRRRALDILRAKVQLLKDMGYIHQDRLTPKGLFASRIHGYELLLSELYADGTLEQLSSLALGLLCTALVYEPRKKDEVPPLEKYVKRLKKTTDKVLAIIHCREHKARIKPLSKKGYFHLAPAMEAWLKGKDFGTMLKCTNVDEGEVVRYLRMSVQILREILDAPISEALREKLRGLIRSINRDVVDSEKQLRI